MLIRKKRQITCVAREPGREIHWIQVYRIQCNIVRWKRRSFFH